MKKITRLLLSMLIVMGLFSFTGCFFDGNKESIYGTYYFNELTDVSERFKRTELNEHRTLLGGTIEVERNKLTLKYMFGGEEVANVFTLKKEGNRYKIYRVRLEGKDEYLEYYCTFSNGIATILADGYSMQFLKDKSKVVEKYDYTCENTDLDFYINYFNSQFNSTMLTNWKPYFSFVNVDIDSGELSLFALNEEYKYSMTKHGNVYNLVQITENVDNPLKNGTVEIVEDELKVNFLYEDTESTIIYNKINY